MAVYKDKRNNTWYAYFSCVDWTGKRKRIKKCGFKTMREAKEYERTFLSGGFSNNHDMVFQRLYELYLEDIKQKYKVTTLQTKINVFETHILPYFKTKK